MPCGPRSCLPPEVHYCARIHINAMSAENVIAPAPEKSRRSQASGIPEATAPRRVHFNVGQSRLMPTSCPKSRIMSEPQSTRIGTKYQVLDVVGEGVSTQAHSGQCRVHDLLSVLSSSCLVDSIGLLVNPFLDRRDLFVASTWV
jgi:hypothetical protein